VAAAPENIARADRSDCDDQSEQNLMTGSMELLLLTGAVVDRFTSRRAQSWRRLQLEFVASISNEQLTALTLFIVLGQNFMDGSRPDKNLFDAMGPIPHRQARTSQI